MHHLSSVSAIPARNGSKGCLIMLQKTDWNGIFQTSFCVSDGAGCPLNRTTEAVYVSGEPSFLAVESGQEIYHHLLVLTFKTYIHII